MEDEPKIDEMLPPEPTKPSDSECCGTGCVPCVFDIYEKQLAKWKIECDKIKKSGYKEFNPLEIENFISQEKYQELEILEIVQESKSMKIFRFQWNKVNGKFPVELGQHVLIRENNISRQYTILRVDDENCIFEILIKIYPQRLTQDTTQITLALEKKRSGDKLQIRGPFGTTFDYKPNFFSHLFLISCGTGLAPMYRIIEGCLENEKDETKIRVLFSSHLDDIPLISSFKRWSAFWNFQAVHFISKSENICDNNTNKMQLPYYGMKIIQHKIDMDELKEQITISKCNLETTLFCICGTKSFEKDIINYLSKNNISESKIKLF